MSEDSTPADAAAPAPADGSTARDPPRDVSRWRVGEIELNEALLELRLRGERVSIERKPLELLMWLLRHPDEVVTKDDLFDALWTGRVVTESVLTKCVAKLRHAIGDDTQTVLKTVHGFGYRLVAPVERLALNIEPPAASALVAGTSPPQRPNWQLASRYGGSRGENWLAVHAKSGEKRVFKFALDAAGLSQLKREITLNRLLRDTLGPREDLVRVLDWNLAEEPCFLELEHCAQGSLIDWLDAQGGAAAVPLALRLELVAQTADALAAAHSAGVLHKDVKPGNVMMALDATGAPRVRLGDFGSGRVLDTERLQALQITRMGLTQTLADEGSTSGTWAYLAPEVVAGQPPTVRSDIFALGVLLYQLAVGDLRRPLALGWERDIDDPLLREDVAICCDQDAARRLGDAAELARRLRGLPARRAERAAQAQAAAEAAAAQQALARARTRRRWLTSVAMAATAGLAVTLALLWQVREARLAAESSARTALARAQTLQAVNQFLTQDLIEAADPLRTGQREQTVRAALQAAEGSVATRFAGQPLQEAAIQRALGNAYFGLSEFAASRRALERSRSLLAAQAADPDSRVQVALELVTVLGSLDDLPAQRSTLDEAQRLAADPQVAEGTRLRLQMAEASQLNRHGRYADAVAAYAALRAPALRVWGDRDETYAELVALMAEARINLGVNDDALALAREAVELKRRVHGDAHVRTLEQVRQLAATLRGQERFGEATALLDEASALAQAGLGAQHDVSLRIETERALVELDSKQYAAAERRFRAALAVREQVYGPQHRDTRTTMNNLAFTLGELGRPAESLALFHKVYEAHVQTYGKGHARTLTALQNIARTHMDMRQWQAAAAVQVELLAYAEAAIPTHWHHGLMRMTAGQTQKQLGNEAAARQHFEQSVRLLEASLGEAHPRTQRARQLLAEIGTGASLAR
jgi:eukaryotic-like serine/threonine-protein kinase